MFLLARLWLICLLLFLGADFPASADTNIQDQVSKAQNALRQNDTETALILFAAINQSNPQSQEVQRDIEQIITAGLPQQLPLRILSHLPLEAALVPEEHGILITPKPYLVTEAMEPQHNWHFSKISYFYITSDASNAYLFCRVHYTTPQDASFAIRTAKMLALAHQTLVSHTGFPPSNSDAPFDVWLCRGGQSGGEQWRDNIYFYDLDQPRSSIEWIREITHEYSHLALPPIGGYTAPEYWANGYLGERLIVRWLQRMPNGSALVQHAWGDFSGAANFDRVLISPALALYKRIGPNAHWLAQTDEMGMRYFIGQVLMIDDKYGAHRLGAAFQRLPRFRETRPADLVSALAEVSSRP